VGTHASPGEKRTFGKNKLIPNVNKGRSPALSSKITTIKEEKETPPKVQVKKPPSKYMLKIIEMNFVNLIHKYDEHQKVKRIEAMKKTR